MRSQGGSHGTKRGRKKKNLEIDQLMARTWGKNVKWVSGLKTPAEIERAVCPHTFKKRPKKDEVGGYIYPCYFSKLMRGERIPGDTIIERTNKVFPGTDHVAKHPFWRVARCPPIDIGDLYLELSKLDEEISSLFFDKVSAETGVPRRKPSKWFEILKQLDWRSDLDALTACVGLFQESEYFRPTDVDRFMYGAVIMRVFLRLCCQPPFVFVAEDLFDYLKRHFLLKCEDEEWKEEVNTVDINVRILITKFLISFLSEIKALKVYWHVPSECLHIVDKYTSTNLLQAIIDITTTEDIVALKKLPDIRNMVRALRRWEKKKLGMSQSRYNEIIQLR